MKRRSIDTKRQEAKSKLVFWITVFSVSILLLIVFSSIAHSQIWLKAKIGWIAWYTVSISAIFSIIGIFYCNEAIVKCNLEYHYLKNRSEITVFNQASKENLLKETLKSAKYGIFTHIPDVNVNGWKYIEGMNKRADYANSLIDFTNESVIDKELGDKDDAMKKSSLSFWLSWFLLVAMCLFLFIIITLTIVDAANDTSYIIGLNLKSQWWYKNYLWLLLIPIFFTLLFILLLRKDILGYMIDIAADFYNLQTHKNKLAAQINPEIASKEQVEQIKQDNIEIVIEDLQHGTFNFLGSPRIELESRIREGRWDYINNLTFNQQTNGIQTIKRLENAKKQQWEAVKTSYQNSIAENEAK